MLIIAFCAENCNFLSKVREGRCYLPLSSVSDLALSTKLYSEFNFSVLVFPYGKKLAGLKLSLNLWPYLYGFMRKRTGVFSTLKIKWDTRLTQKAQFAPSLLKKNSCRLFSHSDFPSNHRVLKLIRIQSACNPYKKAFGHAYIISIY